MHEVGLRRLLEHLLGRPAAEPATDHRALRIMLTNDDGWSASGIQCAKQRLSAVGHDVVIVAPEDNQSGAGARIAFSGELGVKRQDRTSFSVGGSPAEATEFGLSVVFRDEPPDLVISGINSGQNVGAIVIHSGTVGAVVTALADGVPAIAISAEVDLAGGATPYESAAEFLVELVGVLASADDVEKVLPDGVGLNVNIPFVEQGEERGVVAAQIGRGFIDLDYFGAELPLEPGDESVFQVGFTLDVLEPIDDADTVALANNDITISPITPSYSPPSVPKD